mmetsp:Transcript_44945/g.106730  ORF Transcript_44945/g.106730 Transcript_44945/m.106730 type:complete len:383 (-) Transcript_44945:74-1222(-)
MTSIRHGRRHLSVLLLIACTLLGVPSQASAPIKADEGNLGTHSDGRERQEECSCDEAKEESLGCHVSKVAVREDHSSASGAGVSLAQVSSFFGAGALTKEQRRQLRLVKVAETSLSCLDDRLNEPVLATPGGDLGEFILALATYLDWRVADPEHSNHPTQQLVDSLLQAYLESIPKGRPMVHCTDDRAIAHLEAEVPVENLDLNEPPQQAKDSGLLQKLTEFENHGDSHIRLMLKQPEWFELPDYVVPMALKAFYSALWRQNQDEGNRFHKSPRLRLVVLSGASDPGAFVEVSSGDLCEGVGVAPAVQPHTGARSVLVSHLDAASERRKELATFFSRVASTTPIKMDSEKLHQRLDRHGFLALETTGSRVAAGLPFYTLSYS